MYLHFTYLPSWLAKDEFNLPLFCRNLEGELSLNSLAFLLLPFLKNVTCYSTLPIRVINKQLIPHPVIVALRCLQYFCPGSE